jgi:hypothetical protein
MLGKVVIGEDALSGPYRWIVIPVASNGTNTTEMHIKLAARCNWPQLRDMSFLELGDLSPLEFEGRLFFAAACFEFVDNHCHFYPEFIANCLNTLGSGEGETIALVLWSVSQEQLDLIVAGVSLAELQVDVYLPEPARPSRRPDYADYGYRESCRDRHLSRKELGLESIY